MESGLNRGVVFYVYVKKRLSCFISSSSVAKILDNMTS